MNYKDDNYMDNESNDIFNTLDFHSDDNKLELNKNITISSYSTCNQLCNIIHNKIKYNDSVKQCMIRLMLDINI